ncbi:glucose-fructose oxidoreductase, partial [Aeromicrobium sp. PE09-221]
MAPALRLTKNCELKGIVTGTPSKVERWQKEYGIADRNVYDYESLPRIADNPDIYVVFLLVPTSLHAKYSIMAAEAGKHVWCEKPMAMNVEECQAIIDACERNKVSLSIGYRMQHEPNTQTVIQFAEEKPYGPIRNIRAVAGGFSDDHTGWRMDPKMGGGALYDMGVYSINAIRYASGEEPVRVVRARQWADRPDVFTEVDENTEFDLELPSGVIAYGKASRFDNENRLRVEAEKGWYQLQPMQSYNGVKGETSDGKKLNQEIENQQARQMDNEALAILEQRPPVVPAEEGLRDVRIVTAIIEAARTGKAVNLRAAAARGVPRL